MCQKIFFVLFLLVLQSCSIAPKPPFPEFFNFASNTQYWRGVFHVHTRYSHDSSGSLRSVLRTARKHHLDFVVVTDHNTLEGKSEYQSLKIDRPPFLIFGEEISTSDGHLTALGISETIDPPIESQKAIHSIREQGGFSIIAHPFCNKSAWHNWNAKDFDALEVYNHACDFYDGNKIAFLMKSLLLSPSLFAKYVVLNPEKTLKKWDRLMAERSKPIFAFFAADAHVRYRILGYPLMRYSQAFKVSTLYAVTDSDQAPNEEAVLKALVSGRFFNVFEALGQVDSFAFEAKAANQSFPMGSTIQSESPVTLSVQAPRNSEIRLIRDGSLAASSAYGPLTFDVSRPGIYRVEVFRHGKLWIVSNPIAVQS